MEPGHRRPIKPKTMKAKVKFKVDHYGPNEQGKFVFKAGDEILLADSTAKALVESGVATLVTSKKK